MRAEKYTSLVVFSVILLFLIAGCKGNGEKPDEDEPFIGGTEGLQIEFAMNRPPDEIYDNANTRFRVWVGLKNMGEFPNVDDGGSLKTTEVRVNLEGVNKETLIDPDEIDLEDLIDKNPPRPLNSRKKEDNNIIEPETVHVVFPDETNSFYYYGEGSYSPTFRADVCYKYGTYVQSEICVVDDLVNPSEYAYCDPKESKKVYSSSSPVKVTSFTQSVIGSNRIRFTFDVQHVGDGVVYVEQSEWPNCSKEERSSRINKVNVNVDTGLSNLVCNLVEDTKGVVNLENDRGIVSCTQKVAGGGGEFEQPVKIKLNFNYYDTAFKPVIIKHLASDDDSDS